MLAQLFTRKIPLSTRVSLLLLVLLFPLGCSLPAWWGWENGPIENMQVVVLGAGAVLSWLAARSNQEDSQMHKFWLWTIPVWLLMIGRELSWGRVFFDPLTVGPDGPTFPSIEAIWYGRYVYPINTVIIVSTLWGLWHNFNWSKIKQLWRIPAVDMILMILFAIAAQLVFEKHLIAML